MGIVEIIAADLQGLRDEVSAGLESIGSLITALRAQIAEGTATEAQLDAIDAQVLSIKKALTDKEAAVTAEPVAPAPTEPAPVE